MSISTVTSQADTDTQPFDSMTRVELCAWIGVRAATDHREGARSYDNTVAFLADCQGMDDDGLRVAARLMTAEGGC